MSQSAPLDLQTLRARLRGEGGARSDAESRSLGFFECALLHLDQPTAILLQGQHRFANPAYEALFGVAPGETLVGRSLSEVLAPETWQAYRTLAHHPVAGGTWTLEGKGLRRDGSEVELGLSGQTFLQGGTAYQTLTVQDLRVRRQTEHAFRRNEQGWRHLFEASSVGVAVLDGERRLLDANPCLLRLLGAPMEALAGRPWASLLIQPTRGQGGGAQETRLAGPDGHSTAVAVESHPMYHADGRLQGYLAIVQDQSRLQALEAKEALLLQALEQSPATIVITDAAGAIEYVNPTFTEHTGYAREEVLGVNPRILKSDVQDAPFYQDMWDTLLSGRTWTGRLCNKRRDQSLFWEKAIISPILEHGSPRHFLAIKEDLTPHLALESANNRLVAAIDQARDGVFLATRFGRLLYANKAMATLIPGAPFTPQAGAFLPHLLPTGQRAQLFHDLRKALATSGTWEGRVHYPPGLHPARTLGCRFTLVRDPDGLDGFLVGVVQDLTLELQAERNQLHMEKLTSLGALAEGVARDFNNVLSAILTSTELMEWQLDPKAPLHAKVQIIRQAALRAKEINRRLQSFSQRQDSAQVPFDLSALVKEVCYLLASTLPPGIEVRSTIASSVWTTGDPAQLHQVLLSLAMNGYRAMVDTGGLLEITLAEVPQDEHGLAGPHVLLTVADTGETLDLETRSQMFQPCYEDASGRGRTGLALAQRILAAHGGGLSLDSAGGLGTWATAMLPSIPPPSAGPASRPDSELAGIESLLFICSDEVQMALMKQGMERLGYQVKTLTDPVRAMEEVRRFPDAFDVVVADGHIRGVEGSGLSEQLHATRKDISLVMITEAAVTEESVLLTSQADAYLAKPLTIQDLAATVREVSHLGRHRGTAAVAATDIPEGRIRVLLAEDSTTTRALVRSWLEKRGCDVVEARDGEAAWIQFAEYHDSFDVVFTDIVMPRVDGLQLTERIRSLDPNIPVVVLSSLEDQASVKAALHLRADEFLNKPFTHKQLGECLDRQLRKLEDHHRTRESQVTAKEVRQAQKALVATPEPDVPFYTVHHALTDAGGDFFKCFPRPDGSLLFVLGDVVGHSVLSSYAVASFLGMLGSLVGSGLPLRELAVRLNLGIEQGPFPQIPVCVLLGQWQPRTGRVHLVNAGIPHGISTRGDRGRTLAINGTPLGFFLQADLEEKVLWLRPGERLLFATDGIMDTRQEDGSAFDAIAASLWHSLQETPLREALEVICGAAQGFGADGIQDDILAIAFAQGPVEDAGLMLRLPSTMEAVDEAIEALRGVMDAGPKGIPLTRSTRFNIEVAAREALTNAVAHGNAGEEEAEVTFHASWSPRPPRLTLTVVDEGVGYDPQLPDASEDPLSERGRGRLWIRQHAASVAMVGGELTFTFAWET